MSDNHTIETLELGQLAFSSPQQYTVPYWVSDELYDLLNGYAEYINTRDRVPPDDIHRYISDWDVSYLIGFPDDGPLILRRYDWGWDGEEEYMLPNIEFGGVSLWMYKYLGRGMSTNTCLTEDEWERWLDRIDDFIQERWREYGQTINP